jgi:hypothetical protein
MAFVNVVVGQEQILHAERRIDILRDITAKG